LDVVAKKKRTETWVRRTRGVEEGFKGRQGHGTVDENECRVRDEWFLLQGLSVGGRGGFAVFYEWAI